MTRHVRLIELPPRRLCGSMRRAVSFNPLSAVAKFCSWARRAARRTIRRGRSRPAGATIGLHRFSLTQLAARLAAPILAAQGLAPVDASSAPKRWRRARRSRRSATPRWSTSRRSRRRPAFRARSPARCRSCGSRGSRGIASGVAAARRSRSCRAARALRRAVRRRQRHRSRDALRRRDAGAASLSDRQDLLRFRLPSAAAAARRSARLRGRVRVRRSALHRTPAPSASPSPCTHLPSRSATSPPGPAQVARSRARGARADGRHRPRRAAPLSVRPNRSRRSASPPATCGSFRRRAKDASAIEIARRILQEARARRAVRRDGGVRARAAALRRPARARARRALPTSAATPRLVRSRHAPPASGRPRVPRAARVRLREALRAALRRVPVARPGAAAGRSARGGQFVAPDDEALALSRFEVRGRGPTKAAEVRTAQPSARRASTLGPRQHRLRRRRHRRRHAARAVEVGDADRRVGGHRRRSGAVASPRSTGWPNEYRLHRSTTSAREDPESPRAARHRARPPEPRRTCARSRCRSSIGWPSWPASGDVGRVARSLRGARADGAARSRSACCACWPSCGRWRDRAGRRSTKRATCSPTGC